jgi:hypothetical protein
MESVTLNVNEIGASDRQSLEHVLGQPLLPDQRLVIQILSTEAAVPSARHLNADHPSESATLPEWCNVYEGLSDEEIASIESSIKRSPGGRLFS